MEGKHHQDEAVPVPDAGRPTLYKFRCTVYLGLPRAVGQA